MKFRLCLLGIGMNVENPRKGMMWTNGLIVPSKGGHYSSKLYPCVQHDGLVYPHKLVWDACHN